MQGAELPLPRNAKENEELANIFKDQVLARNLGFTHKTLKMASLWLRVDDSVKEGKYVDSETQVEVTYFNWSKGSPNNWKWTGHYKYSHIDQDYVMMYDNGKWNDLATYDKAHTVCQKKI